MTKFGNWLVFATGFAILAIAGTLTNGTSKALAESDTFTTIDPPGASATFGQAINPRGDIVGQYDDSAGVSHAFLFSEGSFTTIDFPGASGTIGGNGINPRGDIVGSYNDSAGVRHGWLLSRGGRFTTIDFPGASFTSARGINARGDIVGHYLDSAGVRHGFLLSGAVSPRLISLARALPIMTAGSTLAAISWDGMMTVPAWATVFC